jgi:hypothetical protein
VSLFRIARKDTGNCTTSRERDVDNEIVPGHARDLKQFIVQRIVFD